MGFYFFIATVFSACSITLEAGIGMEYFYQNMTANSEICINITSFDYYLILGEMNEDMILTEYRSTGSDSQLILYNSSTIDKLPNYHVIPYPFASQTLSIKSPGIVSFSYGSLPGMCSKGIFFCNPQLVQIAFKSSYPKPYDISYLDDKCIVFSARGNQFFSITIDTEFCCDKLLIYQNLTNFIAISGHKSNKYKFDSSKHPIVLRYISDNTTKSHLIEIIMQTDSESHPYKESIDFYDPLNGKSNCSNESQCTFWKAIKWKILLIIIISLILYSFFSGIIFYYCSLWKCKYYIKFDHVSGSGEKYVLPSERVIDEKGTEPKGYYILDPVLRPNFNWNSSK